MKRLRFGGAVFFRSGFYSRHGRMCREKGWRGAPHAAGRGLPYRLTTQGGLPRLKPGFQAQWGRRHRADGGAVRGRMAACGGGGVSMTRMWQRWPGLHCRGWRSACCALSVSFLLATPLLGQAAPAPWFWWYSKVDGKRVCAQASPGFGWERGDTAFRDIRCAERYDPMAPPRMPRR